MTRGRAVVSHGHIAPIPSTTPPNKPHQPSRRSCGVARHDLAPMPSTVRPIARYPDPAALRTSRRIPAARHRPQPRCVTARGPAASPPAAPLRSRPPPLCPRAGLASAWGHPRAQAKGRARGPYHAAPSRGHQLGRFDDARPRTSTAPGVDDARRRTCATSGVHRARRRTPRRPAALDARRRTGSDHAAASAFHCAPALQSLARQATEVILLLATEAAAFFCGPPPR